MKSPLGRGKGWVLHRIISTLVNWVEVQLEEKAKLNPPIPCLCRQGRQAAFPQTRIKKMKIPILSS
ncbi:MAG: hypothetical protein DYG83_16150 [Candidatus Brocadia sp. AMX2]|nr:MAG: hypothetical protein EDM70_17545 [Candidatus Brocadia sp. AMX2]MBC6933571.1 hypothetical protein [Candidatus Brocadia sp.]MBL1170372.1 hypothetical protein [Candidatus Brocadia sp. AMX1]MCE7868316.1 hypothetical protein [Candidatus Brocadia sp. AMX2]MCQ3918694.1 hypothetical protein [Candidatus Brocadia sp.]